jgi:BlaI family penicillinase repressor
MSPSPLQPRGKPTTLPAISDAEWIVMREFWARGSATVTEVATALAEPHRWKPATVQTLVTRLKKKGALGFTKNGREHVYHPLVNERDCLHDAGRSFIERITGGRLAPLLACLAEREDLSSHDIAEMKRILESKGQ